MKKSVFLTFLFMLVINNLVTALPPCRQYYSYTVWEGADGCKRYSFRFVYVCPNGTRVETATSIDCPDHHSTERRIKDGIEVVYYTIKLENRNLKNSYSGLDPVEMKINQIYTESYNEMLKGKKFSNGSADLMMQKITERIQTFLSGIGEVKTREEKADKEIFNENTVREELKKRINEYIP